MFLAETYKLRVTRLKQRPPQSLLPALFLILKSNIKKDKVQRDNQLASLVMCVFIRSPSRLIFLGSVMRVLVLLRPV